jgi:hypothetical protein
MSSVAFAGSLAGGSGGYSDWQPTTGETKTGATDWNNSDYIRSTTVTTDGTLTVKIIEDYKLGNDGYMYVTVLNGEHLDFFRFPYEYIPDPGGPPDPFGTFGDPGSGSFVPPDPTDFYNGAVDYGGLGGGAGGAPEPGVYLLMLTGLGLIGGVLRSRRRRTVSV